MIAFRSENAGPLGKGGDVSFEGGDGEVESIALRCLAVEPCTFTCTFTRPNGVNVCLALVFTSIAKPIYFTVVESDDLSDWGRFNRVSFWELED